MTGAETLQTLDPGHIEDASEYELLRVIEGSRDPALLAAALREREQRLHTRHHSREFWQDVFYQETRRLRRDDIGGEFVTVRVGSYLVGDERTIHTPMCRVDLEQPYAIGRFPVTEGEYLRFVEAGGYETEAYWDAHSWAWRSELALGQPWLWTRYPYGPARSRHPMSGVSYFEAAAYCRWRTEVEQGYDEVRLATGTEWEIAARGRLGRRFPWGWTPDPARANVASAVYSGRMPVNRFPGGVSPHGCWDMVGNVSELVADAWPDGERLRGLRDRVGTLVDNPMVGLHVGVWALCMAPVRLRLRSGSFKHDWNQARAASARYVRPDERVEELGFRVVATPARAL